MKGISDTAFIFLGLFTAIAGVVAIAALTNGAGADAETQKALGYAIIGLTGALGGVAKRRDTGDNP